MKILPALLGAALLIGAPCATFAADATASQPIEFSYALDRSLLADETGAQAVYRDLRSSARRACKIAGVRGLAAVDQVCVADLIDKVISASGSAELEQRFADSRSAELIQRDAAAFEIVSR
jgi:UrcA family protein